MERNGPERGEWNGKADRYGTGETYRFILTGFGLGPGSDVSRTSPSRGENFILMVGTTNVGLGLIPNFALGSIADVSSPASTGGDSLVLGVGNVNGWFDVRGTEIGDIGQTSPLSCRMAVGAHQRHIKRSVAAWGTSGNGKGPHV